MSFCGIDPSKKTGLVLLAEDGTLIETKHLRFDGIEGCKRLHLIAQSVSSLLGEWQPDHLIIESIAFGNPFSKVEMAQFHGIIRLECYRLGFNWWDVGPTVLKKWLTGDGHADKKKMAKAVKDKWDFTSKSDDVVDAYALARIGMFIQEQGVGTLKGVKFQSN